MKKILIFLLVLLCIAGFYFMPAKEHKKSGGADDKNKQTEAVKKSSDDVIETNAKDEIKFNLTGNMQILPFEKNNIIIFDGKKLVKKDDKFKDIFSARLEVNDFVIKTANDRIYVLDRTSKTLYCISKDGEVTAQAKFAENAKNIYALENADVIVQYNTSVTTDGIIIFDKDLKKKMAIDYPKAVVNTLSYGRDVSNIVVSCQVVSDTDMKNAIYLYNNKYEVMSLNQIKDMVIMNIAVLGKNLVLLDPYNILIKNEKFEDVAKLQARRSFEGMFEMGQNVYVKDGASSFRIIDQNGKAVDEKSFRQPISEAIHNSSDVYFVGKDEIYMDSKKITTQKDIQKAVLLENGKIIIFFRNSVEILDVKG